MAVILQRKLFGWEEIEGLGDLQRLLLVLENLPDENLMRLLENDRGNGRNDYPVRGVWNAILAGIVYQHLSIESLRRELARNGQLRYFCGLTRVPPSWVFSRFLHKLIEYQTEVFAIFDTLVEQIRELLPEFGSVLAIDGKALETHANPRSKNAPFLPKDGRRDNDADHCKKEYHGQSEDGSTWTKVVRWFGFRLHLIVDAQYELPVAFEVEQASKNEMPVAHDLLDTLKQVHPELLKDCKYFLGDRGVDDGKLITKLWDEYQIKPVIDIRNMWKDGEVTRLVCGENNVAYNYCGTVYCYCPATGIQREMAYGGFEKDRETLKFRCPAAHYRIDCQGKEQCLVKGSIRISMEEDRRIFTPLARPSYKWKSIYKMRSSVERVNGRLDVSFGFENHYIRGLAKMKMRCGLALMVMLAMAKGRILENQEDKIRSLVQAA